MVIISHKPDSWHKYVSILKSDIIGVNLFYN